MNSLKKVNLAAAAVFSALCCLFTACTSLQGKMARYDTMVRSQMKDENWNEAKRIIESAQFGNKPEERYEVEIWRSREHRILKHGFALFLQQKVDAAQDLYMRGSIDEGDEYRTLLNSERPGIPEMLSPCVDLATSQMSSDRAIAEMTKAYLDCIGQVEQVDVDVGKEAIRKLEAIEMRRKQVDKMESEVFRFKEMLASAVAERWAPLDVSQYETVTDKMQQVREKFAKLYKARSWNARVLDRRADYKKILELIDEGRLEKAKRDFMQLSWLMPPEGLQDGLEFDELSERTKIAGKGLGEMVVTEIVESGLAGVQIARRNANHELISAIVVGRVPLVANASQREKRDAGRAARLQASAEFARYLDASVSAKTEMSISEVDGEEHGSFSASTSESVEAKVSNLSVLATCLKRKDFNHDEIVYVLGWRDPAYGGIIVPEKMNHAAGNANLTISPSIGAYL